MIPFINEDFIVNMCFFLLILEIRPAIRKLRAVWNLDAVLVYSTSMSAKGFIV